MNADTTFDTSVDYITRGIKDILLGRSKPTINELCATVFDVTNYQQFKRLPVVDYGHHNIIMYARTKEEYVERAKLVYKVLKYHYQCNPHDKEGVMNIAMTQ
jgi:hypothetical protein